MSSIAHHFEPASPWAAALWLLNPLVVGLAGGLVQYLLLRRLGRKANPWSLRYGLGLGLGLAAGLTLGMPVLLGAALAFRRWEVPAPWMFGGAGGAIGGLVLGALTSGVFARTFPSPSPRA